MSAARPVNDARAEPAPKDELLLFDLNELPPVFRFGRPNRCATDRSSSAVNAQEIAASVSSYEKGNFTSEESAMVGLNNDEILCTEEEVDDDDDDFEAIDWREWGVLKIGANPFDGFDVFVNESIFSCCWG